MNSSALTVAEFCKNTRISKSFFYKLLKQGNAPKIMKAGRRTLISIDAIQNWQKAMEVNN